MTEPDLPESMKEDASFMALALREADKAAKAGEVPVGAVLVRQGQVIASGHNGPIGRHDPTEHAEISVIRVAAKSDGNYRLGGTTLYVTLEPCAMCAGAIAHARIDRVVFAAADPKGGAVLHGPKFFEQPTCHHRPEISSGVYAEESAELLRAFFKARRN